MAYTLAGMQRASLLFIVSLGLMQAFDLQMGEWDCFLKSPILCVELPDAPAQLRRILSDESNTVARWLGHLIGDFPLIAAYFALLRGELQRVTSRAAKTPKNGFWTTLGVIMIYAASFFDIAENAGLLFALQNERDLGAPWYPTTERVQPLIASCAALKFSCLSATTAILACFAGLPRYLPVLVLSAAGVLSVFNPFMVVASCLALFCEVVCILYKNFVTRVPMTSGRF